MNLKYFVPVVLLVVIFISGCSIPSGSTQKSESKIIFVGPQQSLQGNVGQEFKYSFCKPDVEGPAVTCGGLEGSTTDPTDGKPPYSFEAKGILPPGLALNLNGLLVGTPTLDGTYNFQICAKDLQTNQGCADIIVVVKKPEIEHKFSVDSTNCKVINKETASEGGPAYDIYTFDVSLSGTVTGPVNSVFSVLANTVGVWSYGFKDTSYIRAASWTGRISEEDGQIIRLQRKPGDPTTTTWESGGFIATGQGVSGFPVRVQMIVSLYNDESYGELFDSSKPIALCSP